MEKNHQGTYLNFKTDMPILNLIESTNWAFGPKTKDRFALFGFQKRIICLCRASVARVTGSSDGQTEWPFY